jgi:hypothetical protein
VRRRGGGDLSDAEDLSVHPGSLGGTVRIILVPLVALIGLLSVAASDAPMTTTTVVAEEQCDGSDLVLSQHDACSVTMISVTAEGTAPTLQVRLTTAAPEGAAPTGALLVWRSGDCGFIVNHDGGTTAGLGGSVPEAFLRVVCGESEKTCTVDLPINEELCEVTYEDETHLEIAPAVRDGNDIVLDLEFSGLLSEWAALHDSGALIEWSTGTVGPRISGDPVFAGPFAAGTCGTRTPCNDIGGDFIYGDRAHELPAD